MWKFVEAALWYFIIYSYIYIPWIHIGLQDPCGYGSSQTKKYNIIYRSINQ